MGLYQAIGGRDTCYKLSAAFYARVREDSVLRPFFPGKSVRCATEAFAAFLAQLLDGPGEDAQRRWWLSLRESHLRFKIGRKERDAWMRNMIAALDDVEFEEPIRLALLDLFERSSAYLVNEGPAPDAVPHPSAPPADRIYGCITGRWDLQRTLDEAVAAVRYGDADGAIALAEGSTLQACFQRNRPVLACLLSLMSGSGHSVMLDYVRHVLLRDPGLVHERFSYGRTLLHTAAGEGSLTAVEFLLSLGADADAGATGGAHTPLYSLANECCAPGGGSVVRALVRSGANVNARDQLRITALHMAARRGNVEIAEALLDCGAEIEARDRLGDTPLRRAVNCNQTEVAALLISRGADVHSSGSKRLTPLLAARTDVMKRLLESRKS